MKRITQQQLAIVREDRYIFVVVFALESQGGGVLLEVGACLRIARGEEEMSRSCLEWKIQVPIADGTQSPV